MIIVEKRSTHNTPPPVRSKPRKICDHVQLEREGRKKKYCIYYQLILMLKVAKVYLIKHDTFCWIWLLIGCIKSKELNKSTNFNYKYLMFSQGLVQFATSHLHPLAKSRDPQLGQVGSIFSWEKPQMLQVARYYDLLRRRSAAPPANATINAFSTAHQQGSGPSVLRKVQISILRTGPNAHGLQRDATLLVVYSFIFLHPFVWTIVPEGSFVMLEQLFQKAEQFFHYCGTIVRFRKNVPR